LIIAKFADGATLLQAQTPVDHALCDVMMTMVLPRGDSDAVTPSGKALARYKMACRQVENDIVIWSHRHPDLPSHLIADEVSPFRTFSKWKSQFYVSAAERPNGDHVTTPARRASIAESEIGS
jgi:hypothetical protein